MVFYALEFVSESERGEVISVPRPLHSCSLCWKFEYSQLFRGKEQSSGVRDGMLAVRGDEQ